MLIEAFPLPAGQPSDAMDGIGQSRERLLKRLNELLASSFDYEATIRQICWLAVPDLADWCAVYLLDHDGNATRVSVAHADRADATLARALENADPPRSGELPGVLKILEDGRPVVFTRVGEAELAWLARGPMHLQLLRLTGIKSVLATPLSARGQVVGVLLLATARSGRAYTEADVGFANELASRCAVAADNARLYRETHDALHRNEESLALLDTLLGAAPDGLAFIDRDLRWVHVNEALANANAKSVEQLIGRSVLETAAPGGPALEPLLRRVLERGEPVVDVELSGDGTNQHHETRHHLVSVYPVRHPGGELLGLGVVAVDITERKRAENALRDSEARYRRLVETANEGIWLVDDQARTTFVNQRMAAMLGYEPGELAGASVLEFTDDETLARDWIRNNLAGISEQFDFPLRHRDGSSLLALVGTSPVTNSRGDTVGALGMFSDITDRRRAAEERDRLLQREQAAHAEAEAARRRLELLAGASHILASSLDYEATLRQVAWLAVPDLAEWCAVFLVEAGGTMRLGALAHADPARAAQAQELLEAGASVDDTMRMLQSFGARSTMKLPMIARGRKLGGLLLAKAEPEQRYEGADVVLGQQLADRCAQALDNALLVGDLRQALGVREELLASTSHELRTPLAHIKGFTSSLRQSDIEWDEETRQDFLAEIEREADRLTGLIDDLLTMSRLESGAQAGHPRLRTTLEALVAGGLDRVRGVLGDARVSTDIPPDLPSVVVDAAQLEQVVANLVENAAKYGRSDTEIRIIAAASRGEVELAVEDNGAGIPPEDLERVFDKFYRARTSEQSGVPGTGLGLAICRAIVQANGGRIWAENRPAGGARLIARLPVAGATSAPETD